MSDTSNGKTITRYELGVRLGVTYDYKDDRRNRRYYREVSFAVHCAVKWPTYSGWLDKKDGTNPTHPAAALRGIDPKPSKVWHGYAYHRQEGFSAGFCYRFAAERPSEIISEAEALAEVGGLLAMTKKVEEALQRSYAEHVERVAAEKRQREAAALAGWLAKEADEEAQKVVGYQERLELLRQDLYAEQRRQLRRLTEEGGEYDRELATDEEDWDPKAVLAARLYADRYLPKHKGMIRAASADHKIKLEEVL